MMFSMFEIETLVRKYENFKKSKMATKSKMAAVTKWWPYWILTA